MTRGAVDRLAAFTCMLMIASAAAFGQEVAVLGTIDGRIDGEPQRWHQIALQGSEGTTPMSSWSRVPSRTMPTIYDVTLQGFIEPRFMLERTIAISLSLIGSLPSGCPCRYDTYSASIVYLVEGSMTERLYVSHEGGDAVVVIDRFEPVGNGAYHVQGTFEASLPFIADLRGGPDPNDVVDIVGEFEVDRLPQEAFE